MQLELGDVLLLCSDGVWEPLGNQRLLETLRACKGASEWTYMIDQQIKIDAKPSHDNYTVLTVWAYPDAGTTLEPEPEPVVDPEKTLIIVNDSQPQPAQSTQSTQSPDN
jgi:serine/threonine protein phosphatase PrpC